MFDFFKEIFKILRSQKQGKIINKTAMEQLWLYGLMELILKLKTNNEFSRFNQEFQDQYIITVSHYSTLQDKQFILKTFFDNFQAKSILFADRLSLALYGSQVISGILVHSGEQLTSIVAFANGKMKKVITQNLAGENITQEFIHLILQQNPQLNKYGGEKLKLYFQQIKEQICFCRKFDHEIKKQEKQFRKLRQNERTKMNVGYSQLEALQHYQTYTFLKDTDEQQEIIINNAAFRAPELMFNVKIDNQSFQDEEIKIKSLQTLIYKTMKEYPENQQKVYLANIVLSGGNTKLKGFSERLKSELIYKYKKNPNIQGIINVQNPRNQDNLSYQGVYNICNLSFFQKSFIQKEDYLNQNEEALKKVI